MWQGVIIEESLKDKRLLELVKILKISEATLESESGRGVFHFSQFELPEEKRVEFIEMAKKAIKPGFYLHLVHNDTLTVVMAGKVFSAIRGQAEQFETIRKEAMKTGIHPDQLPLEQLLDNPFT